MKGPIWQRSPGKAGSMVSTIDCYASVLIFLQCILPEFAAEGFVPSCVSAVLLVFVKQKNTRISHGLERTVKITI